ncbi:hypothetical protein SADUNF_Sadunf03G0161800 [Salix dunnii]|uniref:Uncharacterized protein n=1 Tax=Salix dunnii TaxID=1413687 RepID=A0A835N555_9ROSI|nr:hypothetical protein SADUNF_Sadunf03G0161800 [Salix dunnii]
MGPPLPIQRALKLSNVAYLCSAALINIRPQFITEQIILYIRSFSVFLCWEWSHHLHQENVALNLRLFSPKQIILQITLSMHGAPRLMGPVTIKRNTPNTGRRDVASAKKQGGPQHAKACAKADVSRNSIYVIASAFHDEMLTSTKASLLEKGWATGITSLFGTYELLVQKLRHFLDF